MNLKVRLGLDVFDGWVIHNAHPGHTVILFGDGERQLAGHSEHGVVHLLYLRLTWEGK